MYLWSWETAHIARYKGIAYYENAFSSSSCGRQVEKLRGELDTMGVEKAMLQDLKAAVEASLVRAPRFRRADDRLNRPSA